MLTPSVDGKNVDSGGRDPRGGVRYMRGVGFVWGVELWVTCGSFIPAVLTYYWP